MFFVPKTHRFLTYYTCKYMHTMTLKPGLGVTDGHRNRHYTNRCATYDLPLTFHSNHGPISYRFRDKRQVQSKIANASPLKGFPLELGIGTRTHSVMGLPIGRKSFEIGLAIQTQNRHVTDTIHVAMAKTALARCVARVKKNKGSRFVQRLHTKRL